MENTISKSRLWTARVMSWTVIVFILMDGIFKLIQPKEVVETTLGLGYADHHIAMIGMLALIYILLYAYPHTLILGAVLLTGFLGGAIATNFRVGNPLFTHILFAGYLAIIAWGGLWLRDERVRNLIPLQKRRTKA